MNYVIHLTDRCNLNCRYCYESGKKYEKIIRLDDIKKIIDYEINDNENNISFITFYGGEPLLEKGLIKETIKYINSINKQNKFKFNMTTNGTMLDEDFLIYMRDNSFSNISYSIDGIKESHDANRVTQNGEGSYELVYKNVSKLLKYFPNADAMCVVSKNNLKYLSQNVEFLHKLGFKYVNILIDYTEKWNDNDLPLLKEQLEGVAEYYKECLLNEDEIRIPMIEEKIKSYVDKKFDCNKNCKLGMKTIHVGTDGKFYPCSQFVYDDKFVIGNVHEGIDNEARAKTADEASKELDICKKCKINTRCKHICPCKNYMINGSSNILDPLVCELERMIVDISDDIIEVLYNKKSKIFRKIYLY